MATKKAGPPAPIDKPLSSSYLKEFHGWSTAYPPGISDPSSLRVAENVMVTRDGALRIRPALQNVLNQQYSLNTGNGDDLGIVGSFEQFFVTADATYTGKAFLFAVRGSVTVNFRAALQRKSDSLYDVKLLTNAAVGFSGSIPTFSLDTTFIKYLQIDNKILALSDAGDPVAMFKVGTTKTAKSVSPTGLSVPAEDQLLIVRHPDAAWIDDTTKDTIPAAETPTSTAAPNGTLISATAADNVYNFAFWFTFYNEFGEGSPSLLTMTKTKRGWSAWKFNSPTASGEPTDPVVSDPKLAADQLVPIMPAGLIATARTQGALGWNLYLATWADDNPVPSEGVLVASREITSSSTDANASWLQALAAVPAGSVTMPLPNVETREELNYSKGPTARQGLVAGDRLILVNDSQNPALIRWSSNQPTKYTDFSPSFGGGQKTLSSGNLLIPSCVKLWQNPQSVDTITILCEGVDGYHAAYYMAPSSISGLTESTLVMGFEETTATPGTVSPYGVEVFDNDLYHPLETELMKSTASNYNLSHKTLTDDISNKWLALTNKREIVSAQYDGRLYYIVDNPEGSWDDPVSGEPLDQSKYKGNEIWVLDAMSDKPQWNRWLIPAIALRKLEVAGKLRLAVVTPETIYYLADEVMNDHYFPPTNVLQTRPIPWRFETNTMGANRAHNAWANLQQAFTSLGNFYGAMRWGIKGWTAEKQWLDIHRDVRNLGHPQDGSIIPNDMEKPLLIERALKEWVFYGSSIETEGELEESYGQLDYVQFRYIPASVNIDYAAGSIETFEYGRESLSPLIEFGYGEAPYGWGPYGG